jgi:lysophospholipase L1-like esterase
MSARRGLWSTLVLVQSLSAVATASAALTIIEPRPHQVVQRIGFAPGDTPAAPADIGRARVPLVLAGIPAGVFTARARVVAMAAPDEAGPWQRVELGAATADGRRQAYLTVPAGGWYRIEVDVETAGEAAGDTAAVAAGTERLAAAVEPFGVGEVFLVAGQSYATNTNDERLAVADPACRVVARDAAGGWRVADDPQPTPDGSDGGSIWPAVGDELVRSLGVPVGFVNVAWGGTATARWQPGGDLHRRLAATGAELGRFRAVLWQQGESDVIEGTPTDAYVAALRGIRWAAVRSWGFEPPWLCAKSTHHPTVYDDPPGEERIRAAIDRLVALPGFGAGPDTDTLRGEARGGPASRRHFTGAGQRAAARLWAGLLTERLQRPPTGVEAASWLLDGLGLVPAAWASSVVTRESSVLRATAVGEPARARLAYPAERILAVTTADGCRAIDPAAGYTHQAGSHEVVFTTPLPVPPILDAERYLPVGAEHSYRHRVGQPDVHLLYRPGRWFHDRDVEITYRRATAAPPDVVHGDLPRTRARLAAGGDLLIGVSGDSISTGLDASATTATPPFQPGWPDLAVAWLRVHTAADVTLVNRAVAGWSVANGVADADALLAARPDLVIVAYGMNDVGRRDPAWFREQTAALVARCREVIPGCELLLVATMLGNDEWIHTPRGMFPRYRDELKGLVGPGVALVDMTAVWEEQLAAKEMFDLTGNGLNHPNDHGHRLYAQGILEALVGRRQPGTLPGE